jgi:ribosomal 50S subunit-recycling heat shock protein
LRIDKYLKVSRLIKRRTIACEACEKGRVLLNGKTAKPGTPVKEGDIVEIAFGNSKTKILVKSILAHVKKDDSQELYEII